MDDLHVPPLIRLLALNTEMSEIRHDLMRLPVASGRIAELQDDMDRRSRLSLTTFWLSGGYIMESDDDWEEEDWDENGLAGAG